MSAIKLLVECKHGWNKSESYELLTHLDFETISSNKIVVNTTEPAKLLSPHFLWVFGQLFLDLGHESRFVFCYSLLHFSPSSWTILVPCSDNAVNRSVDVFLVLARDPYSSSF